MTTTPRSRPLRRGVLTAAACAAAISFLPACSAADPATVALARALDAVGTVAGSTALVAVVVEGVELAAYVCDGPAGLGERFHGILTGDRAELRSPGGATLTVQVSAKRAAGTFTPAAGGPAQPFSVGPSQGAAGLYIADGHTAAGPFRAGWIVLPDGTQTGTFQRADAGKRQAPRLPVTTRSADRDRATERTHVSEEPEQAERTRVPQIEEADRTRVPEPQGPVVTRVPEPEVPELTRVEAIEDPLDPLTRPAGTRPTVQEPDRPQDLEEEINESACRDRCDETPPRLELPDGIGSVEAERIDAGDVPDRAVFLGRR